MNTHIETLNKHICNANKKLGREERLVINVLIEAFEEGKVLTQKKIISTIRAQGNYIGKSAKWEDRVSADSTERRLREIFKTLREDFAIPICSGARGYYLPQTPEDLREYMERSEKTSLAAAQSHIATFNALAKVWTPDLRTRISIAH